MNESRASGRSTAGAADGLRSAGAPNAEPPDGGTALYRGLLTFAVVAAAGCGGALPAGTFELPSEEAARYATAYVAVVVADPPGDDLARGAGEHVVIRNNWDQRADLGGWVVEDADGNRLPLGIGTQLDPDAELRVHTGCGDASDGAVFACLDHDVLDDAGDVVRLLDAGDSEVARFAYGTAAG